MEEIEEVRQGQDGNYIIARRHLEEPISLVQDLVDLYNLLVESIQQLKKPKKESIDLILSASHFLLGCRYQLTLAALSLLRGHLSDSYLFTRKAIELCAFAARVKKHPHLIDVWLHASDDDTSYNTYREKFRPGTLFPEDHVVLKELYNRYDLCSKSSHPSIYSFVGHLETKITPSEFKIDFNYFQVREDDQSEPIRTLLWVVDTHFGILRIFEEVFSDVIASNRTKWEIRRNAVDGKLGVQKGKWKAVIIR